MPNIRLALLLVASWLAGCGAMQPSPEEQPERSPAAIPEVQAIPAIRPFPEDTFYELLVAEFAMRRQQYDIALRNYLHQARRTRDAGVASTAARLGQHLGADNVSLEAARLWLELEPDEPEAHFVVASILARQQQPLEALPHMARVLEAGYDSNFAALAASALNLPEEEQQQFVRELDSLLDRHPDESALRTAKALMLQYRGRKEESLELIRTVLAEDEGDIHALLIETSVLVQLGREEEALESLEAAVEIHPRHKQLRQQLAQLLTESDLEEARRHYAILARQSPRDAEITFSLALIKHELGDHEEARQVLERLLDSPEYRSRAHYFLGRIHQHQNSPEDARAHYTEVSPGEDFMPAMRRVAMLVKETRGLQPARELLDEQRQRYPQQELQLRLIESDLLYQAERYSEGHQLLSELLDDYPEDPDALYARALFNEQLGELEAMERDLRLILRDDPNNATALNALGYTLAIHTDRLKEAYELVDKALRLRPDDPAIQDSYGWIAYLQGDIDTAHEYLRQAFEQMPDHEVAAHFGEVLWRMDRREEAKDVWRDGLRDHPDSSIIRETLQRLDIQDLDDAS